MKKILSVVVAGVMLASCGKDLEFSNSFASVAVINAAPSASTLNNLNTGGFVYVDTTIQRATVVNFRGTSGYLTVAPGTHSLQLRSAFDSAKIVNLSNQSFEANKAYTYVVYDTLTAANRSLKSFRLDDDLTLPAANTAKLRILHLAPNGGTYDVTFVRIPANSSTAPALDSVTFSNITFVGANPDPKVLSAFNRTIPVGPGAMGNYLVKVKDAGTQTVRATAPFSAFTAQGINRSIVTVYITGTTAGQSLGANIFRHYP